VPKKFIFRLESLLRYREHLEQMAQQMVAQAHMDLSECENRLTILGDELGGTLNDLERRMLAGIEADQYHRYTAYVVQLETVLAMEGERHKDLIRILREKQAILSKRSVEKKVLENLKQRKQTEYYDNVTRLLQKESEEMSIIREVREMER